MCSRFRRLKQEWFIIFNQGFRKDTAMISKRCCALFVLLVAAAAASGQQSSPYVLTEFPLAATSNDSKIWVKWTGVVRPVPPGLSAPDSGVLYFDRTPGGSKIENYHYKVDKFCIDTLTDGTIQVESNRSFGGMPPIRGIRFRPKDQVGMDAGVFYYMVAFKTSILGKDTTFYSNELQMIVESPVAPESKDPKGDITQLTPTFSWNANPGVPYYHVILSDEALKIDTAGGLNIKVSVSSGRRLRRTHRSFMELLILPVQLPPALLHCLRPRRIPGLYLIITATIPRIPRRNTACPSNLRFWVHRLQNQRLFLQNRTP
jgi:hypothetical protein